MKLCPRLLLAVGIDGGIPYPNPREHSDARRRVKPFWRRLILKTFQFIKQF